MQQRPELPAYALAGLLVAAIAALAGVHVTVPTVLPYALLGVLGVAGGVSLPGLLARNEPLSASQSPEQLSPGVIQPAPTPPVPVTPVTDVTQLTAVPPLAPTVAAPPVAPTVAAPPVTPPAGG